MAKFCGGCGGTVSGNSKFCTECGSDLSQYAYEPHSRSAEGVFIKSNVGQPSVGNINIVIHDPNTRSGAAAKIYNVDECLDLAREFRDNENYQESLSHYDQALALDSSEAQAWWGRAWLLCYKLERYEEAVVSCQSALEFDPEISEVWSILNRALQRLGRDDEAREAHNKTQEIADKAYYELYGEESPRVKKSRLK